MSVEIQARLPAVLLTSSQMYKLQTQKNAAEGGVFLRYDVFPRYLIPQVCFVMIKQDRSCGGLK